MPAQTTRKLAFPTTYGTGMFLRDYFAGQALHESFGNLPDNDPDAWSPDRLAQCAYEIADAMLKVRDAD